MHISFNTRHKAPETIAGVNGYGTATKGMLASLDRLGYEVSVNDATAPVGINFDQPQHWKWHGPQYRIGYLPWESTLLMPGWADYLNQCDEIWTPSPIVAEWFKRYNPVTPPVYVYEHGIDHSWAYRPRERHNPFKFLTVGGETRKQAYDARLRLGEIFENDEINLTLKAMIPGFKMPNGEMTFDGKYRYLDKHLSLEELQGMHYDHDAYIYLSAGEGFGLTPLQAMATGMPTVTVGAWAPYEHLIDPNLKVKAQLKPSPWNDIHPGLVWAYDKDDARRAIRYVYDNYDECLEYATEVAPIIHERYDWDTLTKKMFLDLENRVKLVAS